ncbi:MAG: sucrase ferredoxin, partial [Nocardioides sp.]
MTAPFRCAVDSSGRPDDLAGTASTVRAFLLVEEPGPWGVDALTDSRLIVGTALRDAARAARVRPLLIRREGRSTVESGRRVFAAYADPVRPWLETTVVERVEDLLDLDLASLGRGESPGLTPTDTPVLAVCTHGRHDTCCAERGRPVAVALAAADPDRTWECSHIGGDRFAGNIVILPDSLYFGRCAPESGVGVIEAYDRGDLDLAHYRGRSTLSFMHQAAEFFARRESSASAIDAVTAVRRVGDAADGDIDVDIAGSGTVRVTVRRSTLDAPSALTCT